MPEGSFQDFLQDPLQKLSATNEEIVSEIEADNEKEYLKEIKKRNKGYLVEGLSILERERVAQHIVDL